MQKSTHQNYEQSELEASLAPLGIREIAERMEVSPLLVDQGDLTQDPNVSICCACKMPWDPSDTIPYPVVEPPMGTGGLF